MTDALVIGGGPAGLMAAETLADTGMRVVVADAKPSVGRKFLMAGKSGLNLTMDQPLDDFLSTYGAGADWVRPMVESFDNTAVRDWATGLGQTLFTGSTGRVFPTAMKASPLLRSWLARLTASGVDMRTRWRWTGLREGTFQFETPNGHQIVTPQVAVLALGGASWARLGSDGAWVGILASLGVACEPFQPSNMGLATNWSQHMNAHFGEPLKNIAINGLRGEAVIGRRGLEGSLIYRFSREIRAGEPLTLDLTPDLSEAEVSDRLAGQPRKLSATNVLRRALPLTAAQIALIFEWAPDRSRGGLARSVKSLPINYDGAAPLDDAISTIGGVAPSALDQAMLHALPGVFCAGEMVDWDAPTGGYLLTACLASGRAAGRQAADYAAAGFRIASARV